MRACEQTAGQTILEHGLSVWSYLDELLRFLNGEPLDETRWRVPKWLLEHRELLKSWTLPRELLREYAIYHDCGKPRCKETDAEGRVHFPDHAEVSYRTWLEIGGSPDVAFLIRNDMKMHTMNSEECASFLRETDPRFSASLLLSALAEVHSNASLFGGIDSTSFKIKSKRIDQRGKQVCAYLKGSEPCR
jgi:hypothetical protein